VARGLAASAKRDDQFIFWRRSPHRIVSHFFCSVTVSLVLWLRLPDLAVTVALYVPAGFPAVVGGGGEPPPPQAPIPRNATPIVSAPG
jgi:hypothetical protein